MLRHVKLIKFMYFMSTPDNTFLHVLNMYVGIMAIEFLSITTTLDHVTLSSANWPIRCGTLIENYFIDITTRVAIIGQLTERIKDKVIEEIPNSKVNIQNLKWTYRKNKKTF